MCCIDKDAQEGSRADKSRYKRVVIHTLATLDRATRSCRTYTDHASLRFGKNAQSNEVPGAALYCSTRCKRITKRECVAATGTHKGTNEIVMMTPGKQDSTNHASQDYVLAKAYYLSKDTSKAQPSTLEGRCEM